MGEEAGEISPSGTSRHNVFFLKQLEHARAIRNRIIECFERASSPSVSEAERRRLLTFVVVGGGPTSIEFTSELYDFLTRDVSLWYPDLATSHSVILVEAGKHLLGSFDETLSNYVEQKFKKRQIRMLTGESVSKVRGNSVELSSGTVLNFGVCVWSTGNSPLDFVKQLGLEMSRQGRILIGPSLKVSGREDVYALGDCAEDRPGHGLQYRYNAKMASAAEECQAQGIAFLPLVVESLGGWDERAVRELKKIASALARSTGEDEGETWRRTIIRLSILLMKGNSALLSGRIPTSPSAFHESGID